MSLPDWLDPLWEAAEMRAADKHAIEEAEEPDVVSDESALAVSVTSASPSLLTAEEVAEEPPPDDKGAKKLSESLSVSRWTRRRSDRGPARPSRTPPPSWSRCPFP